MFTKIYNAIKNPRLFYYYLSYKINPTLYLFSGGKISNFSNFSEYFGTILNQPDYNELEFLYETLDENSLVFDVGGNIGCFSLAVLFKFPNAKLHVFEPSPFNYNRLEVNLINNKVIANLHQMALSTHDSPDIMSFSETKNSPSTMHFAENGDCNLIDVFVTSLDEFCEKENISFIDLLKIDVEGYECDVLLGAERLLNSGAIKTIYIEVCSGSLKRAGSSVKSLWDIWGRFNYEARYLNGQLCRLAELQQVALQNVVLKKATL
ncbi:MAG: FkbM family methyltransferase [Desulfobulbus sp.]|nr:FkbM family methyltransferase [Desulfobulbus sp.]